MMRALFDVRITTFGDDENGEFRFLAVIIDRRSATDGALISQQETPTFSTAIAYARGAVTSFMEGAS
jgi:hypothetical protein